MVFCFKNCPDLLYEKKILVIKKTCKYFFTLLLKVPIISSTLEELKCHLELEHSNLHEKFRKILTPAFYLRKFKYVLYGHKKKSVWGNMRKSVLFQHSKALSQFVDCKVWKWSPQSFAPTAAESWEPYRDCEALWDEILSEFAFLHAFFLTRHLMKHSFVYPKTQKLKLCKFVAQPIKLKLWWYFHNSLTFVLILNFSQTLG